MAQGYDGSSPDVLANFVVGHPLHGGRPFQRPTAGRIGANVLSRA
jgi:hypothetical protein